MNESFSVGRALSLGFSTMFRNIIPFAILGGILFVPVLLYSLHLQDTVAAMTESGIGEDDAWTIIRMAVMLLVITWVMKTLLGASVTYGVVMQVRGQPAGIGPSVVKGVSRLLPVLVIGLLVALIAVGPLVLLAFVSPILALAWIPFAIILYCMYYVAVPASVCEKPGIGGALLRSRDLTSGHKGGIFGMLLVLGLIDYGVGKVLESMFETDPKMFLYSSFGVDLILGILGACVCASTYYLLRSEKEGTSADDLASVFD
jgi:hypothetical protein